MEMVPIRRNPPDTASSTIERVFHALPAPTGYDRAALRECIQACQDCAQAATACAAACLGEEMAEELTGCIRALLTTADICEVTACVLSRRGGTDAALVRALLEACRIACRASREHCAEYLPIHDHGRVCARASRDAEQACRTLSGSLR